jgi:hypothetical protein
VDHILAYGLSLSASFVLEARSGTLVYFNGVSGLRKKKCINGRALGLQRFWLPSVTHIKSGKTHMSSDDDFGWLFMELMLREVMETACVR